MKNPRQPGLFDVEERAAQLTEMGDPLVGLKLRIDWEAFRADLNRVHDKERKSQAGAKPFDVVLMFMILVLQQLHDQLADIANIKYGTDSASCVFWGYNWKTGYRMPKRSGCSVNG
jgi:hypothetical protein